MNKKKANDKYPHMVLFLGRSDKTTYCYQLIKEVPDNGAEPEIYGQKIKKYEAEGDVMTFGKKLFSSQRPGQGFPCHYESPTMTRNSRESARVWSMELSKELQEEVKKYRAKQDALESWLAGQKQSNDFSSIRNQTLIEIREVYRDLSFQKRAHLLAEAIRTITG